MLLVKKIALIQKIETDDKQIDFNYSIKPANRYTSKSAVVNECGARLNSIVLTPKVGSGREQCSFEYTSNLGRFPRDFLTTLNTTQDGKFKFDYVGLTNKNISGPLTHNIDFWGFWRGTPECEYLVPKVYNPDSSYLLHYNGVYELVCEGDDRQPTGNEYDLTLLKSIEYPTGGYTTFEYEMNTYYRSAEQLYAYSYVKYPHAGTDMILRAGGARIKNITYYNGINKTPVKKLRYQYTENPDGVTSSGILTYKPFVALRAYLPRGGEADPSEHPDALNNCFIEYSTCGFKTSPEPNPHIHYATVREYIVDEDNSLPPRDSVVTYRLDSSSGIMTMEFYTWVGSHVPGYDRTTWEIDGSAINGTQETARVVIRNLQGREVFNYTFYTQGNLSVKLPIKYDPMTYLPEGNYHVTMTRTANTSVRFDIIYKLWEKDYIKGPYRELKFTGLHTNFDINTKSRHFNTAPDFSYFNIKNPDTRLIPNFLMPYDNRSYERGKLLEESYYTSSGDLVKTTTYKYENIGSKTNVYVSVSSGIYCRQGLSNYSYVSEQTLSSYLPVEITKKEFDDDGNAFVRREQRSYTDEGYLAQSKTYDSQGYNYITKYSRIIDEPEYEDMHYLNIVSPITTVRKYRISGGTTELVEGYDYKYGIFRGTNNSLFAGLISKIEYGTEPIKRTLVEYKAYDSYGNPIYYQNRKEGSVPRVCLWGNFGKNLIAEIDNATLDDVRDALEPLTIEELCQLRTPDHDAINALRQKLPNAFVSTYGHDSLYNKLIEKTDETGVLTWFKYDDRGRWIGSIGLNENGEQILHRQNVYHYVNE